MMRPMSEDRPGSAPLHRQIEYLEMALNQNEVVQSMLAIGSDLALPNWYLAAGGVAQTVWNLQHGFEPASRIKDYDLVYFDPGELSSEAESQIEEELRRRLPGSATTIDVKNEARVHLWYRECFGRPVEPYRSSEDAIATWPTTASAVGVRYEGNQLVVCAPFGLSDLLGMIVRPNKVIVTRDIYEEKALRWASQWPDLRVIPW